MQLFFYQLPGLPVGPLSPVTPLSPVGPFIYKRDIILNQIFVIFKIKLKT